MAASTVNTTYRSELLSKRLRRFPDACREMLDAFVSAQMWHATRAAEHPRARRLEDPDGSRPPFDQFGTPALDFGPLESNVISGSIPAFFIGRNTSGLWVAREAKGKIGGLFVLRRSAIAFAHEHVRAASCATIFPAERFELDLENKGNPLASYLAPMLRLMEIFDR